MSPSDHPYIYDLGQYIPENSAFEYRSLIEITTDKQSKNPGACTLTTPFPYSTILANTPSPYRLAIEQLGILYGGIDTDTFFYQDDQRTYFVTPQALPSTEFKDPNFAAPSYGRESLTSNTASQVATGLNTAILAQSSSITRVPVLQNGAGSTLATQSESNSLLSIGQLHQNQKSYADSNTRLQFATFWHPHVCAFVKTLNQYGVSGLLSMLTQQRTNDGAVVSGFTLSTSNTLTPGLTPGVSTQKVSFTKRRSVRNLTPDQPRLFNHHPLLKAGCSVARQAISITLHPERRCRRRVSWRGYYIWHKRL